MSFSDGIKKIETMFLLQNILTEGARNLVIKAIEDLINRLIEQCSTNFGSTSANSVMTVDVAQQAVTELFSDDLRDCAIAEGNKALMRYNNGLLSYTPEMPDSETGKVGTKSVRKKKPLSTIFLKGIKDIRGLLFPDASLHPDALKLVSGMLGDLSMNISDAAKNSAQQGQTLTVNNIRSALDDILPEELRKHAQTEGAKMLFFHESGGLPVAKKAAAKVLKKPDKAKHARLKRKKTTIPAKKRRTVRSAKVPRRKRKITSAPKMLSATPKRRKMKPKKTTRKRAPKPAVVSKKKLPSVPSKAEPSGRKRKSKAPEARKRRISAVKKKTVVPRKKRALSVSPRKRKPRDKTIERPSTRPKRAPRVKRSPTKPTKKRKIPAGRAKADLVPTKKRRKAVLSRKKRSPAVSRKIRKPPTSRKKREPSKIPVSKRRAVSAARKKMAPSKRPVSKRRAVSAAKKKMAPSKRPVSKRRAVSATKKKRAPSKRPVSKRRAVSAVRKKMAPSKRPESKRRAVSAAKKKRAPSKRPISKRRAVSATRKKRTPSKRPVSKRRPPFVSKKPKKDKKAPKVITAGLTQGIKNLNGHFQQSLSSNALASIESNLSSLLERLVAEIKKGKSSAVGAKEVREAVLKVFPPKLRDLALANMSRALINCQGR